jgi:hypothetical protein
VLASAHSKAGALHYTPHSSPQQYDVAKTLNEDIQNITLLVQKMSTEQQNMRAEFETQIVNVSAQLRRIVENIQGSDGVEGMGAEQEI